MGEDAHVTIVIAHGAGSSGRAAAALLGPLNPTGDPADVHLVEDRTGDITHVIEALEHAVASSPVCSTVIGISLGAHAVARWAARASSASPHGPLPRLICVLPAWSDSPGAAAAATSAASTAVRAEGIAALLARLDEVGTNPDVIGLLRIAWADYSDASLGHCLMTASTGLGPSPQELASIRAPVGVVGWMGDDFHPAGVSREWARHLRQPTVAIAARPDIILLRRALATLGMPSAATPR